METTTYSHPVVFRDATFTSVTREGLTKAEKLVVAALDAHVGTLSEEEGYDALEALRDVMARWDANVATEEEAVAYGVV